MSLTPTQLEELQTIVLELGEEFANNQDWLWNAAIRIQNVGLGPDGPGGQPAFDALVADMVLTQEQVQKYQGRTGSNDSGFDVSVLSTIPPTAILPLGNVGDILYLQTAPNIYTATDQIQITPAGPNSVQLDEVGTTVARTIPAASGGMEVNNLSTGAGFERVLTLSDMGGGVNSLTAGLNINLTGTGVDPIVNLNAAITGVSVNGVTLSNAGVATNFLDETGAYSAPAGGAPGGADTNVQYNNAGAFGGDANFTWDSTDGILTLNQIGAITPSILINDIDPSGIVFQMGGVGSASTSWDIIRSYDNGGVLYWAINDDHSLSAGNQRLDFNHSSVVAPFIRLEDGGDMYIGGATAANSLSIPDVDASPGQLRVGDNMGFKFDEKAAALAADANFGEIWVRNDTPNVLVFTDDTGADTVLGAGFDPTSNQTISGIWEFTNTGGVGFGPSCELDLRNNADTSTTFIQNLGTSLQFGVAGADFGSQIFDIGQTSFAKLQTPPVFIREQAAAEVDVAGDGQLWVRNDTPNVLMFTGDDGVDHQLTPPPAAGAQISGVPVNNQIAIWTGATDIEGVSNLTYDGVSLAVRDATFFVEDTGGPDSITISVTGGEAFINATGGTTLVNLSGAPFYVTETLFMAERASALADVAGRGQIWVNSTPNPNELMYTDESGNDINLVTDLWNNGTRQVVTTALGIEVRDTLHVGVSGASGVIKLGEQASADADEAGYGQIWVETDTPNRLKFTDDSGQDFDVAMVGGFVSDNVFVNVSRNFNTAGNFAANNILYYADGSNNTVTLENSSATTNWPVYTSITIIAPGSGVQTITEGTGVTLFDDTGTDLVGGCTVSQGVQTIFRASTTDYIIFGSGITP
jgi:hypothetical protein